jgi:hypothetical protein
MAWDAFGNVPVDSSGRVSWAVVGSVTATYVTFEIHGYYI